MSLLWCPKCKRTFLDNGVCPVCKFSIEEAVEILWDRIGSNKENGDRVKPVDDYDGSRCKYCDAILCLKEKIEILEKENEALRKNQPDKKEG